MDEIKGQLRSVESGDVAEDGTSPAVAKAALGTLLQVRDRLSSLS